MRIQSPIGRIRFAVPPPGEPAPEGWEAVPTILARWMAKGCAQITNGEGIVLDVASVATITPEQVGGCELVIFHGHVLMKFPQAVHGLTTEGGQG